jgi:predicted RNA-binding protein associated with RNAse of E/G family
MSALTLSAGDTAVVRGILNGRTWFEWAVRVLDTDASSATTARWPGSATRDISFYIDSLRTGSRELRLQAQRARASGEWALADSVWRRTGVVEQVTSGRWFSVSRMHGTDGALLCWYVNFQRPAVWRGDGWDTNDLALDLVVEPDGAWSWKDEDEFAHERGLGLITDTEYAAVQEARSEAVALIEAREGLFAESAAERWLPDPAWAPPLLP